MQPLHVEEICRFLIIVHTIIHGLATKVGYTTINKSEGKGQAVPLQALRVPEGSRKLRFPDFVTTAQYGGRLSALRTGRLYHQEILLVLISVTG